MIWLVGYELENTFRHTRDRLSELGLAFDVVNLDLIETVGLARHRLHADGLSIHWDGVDMELAASDTVFQRVYPRVLDVPRRRAYQGEFLDCFSAFCETATAVNRPSASQENGLKLFHLARLQDVGLRVPHTCAGTDADGIGRMIAPDGSWVSKGCSGIRTRVTVVDKEDYGQLPAIHRVPVQFQRRIQGDDVRIHVLGNRVVGLRIKTDADDYRYAARGGRDIAFFPVEVPMSIQVKCFEYMRRAGLHFGGFDFRVEGIDWTVLECNAMPGYDYYDNKVDGAVSEALAELLLELEAKSPDDGTVSLPDDFGRACFIDAGRRPSTNHS